MVPAAAVALPGVPLGEGRRTVSAVIRSFVAHFRNCSQCHRKGHQQPSANPGSGLSLAPPAVPLRKDWDRGKGFWTRAGSSLAPAWFSLWSQSPSSPSCSLQSLLEILARELVPTRALPAALSPGPPPGPQLCLHSHQGLCTGAVTQPDLFLSLGSLVANLSLCMLGKSL